MCRSHLPVRTCIVCGAKGPKSSLLRLALRPADGCIAVDRRQTMEGRGAYVCTECLPKLRLTKRLHRAFRDKARGLCEGIAPAGL